jgi:hypothetical protein
MACHVTFESCGDAGRVWASGSEDEGGCMRCGSELSIYVGDFARCTWCAAENYRSKSETTVEVAVAKFWARWSKAPPVFSSGA